MFRTGEAEAFLAGWQKLREHGEIPHFRTVFNRLAPQWVARLMVFELTSTPEDHYIVRFMGTKLAELWAEELTGKDVLAVLSPAIAATARRNMRKVLDQPCGMRNLGLFVSRSGHEQQVEHVMLPAANDPDRPLRMLCFAQELGAKTFTTGAGEVRKSTDHAWLDIGHGVPDKPPEAAK